MYRVVFYLYLALASSQVLAQYHKTLPKGVRMISNRHIQSNIKSSYNKSKSETPYAYKVDADIDTLKNVDNEAIQSILTLFEPYPEALKELSFGSHKIEANAKVKIDVYAFAYGITNKLTAYIGMPIYDAKVKVRYKKLSENSNKKVSEIEVIISIQNK